MIHFSELHNKDHVTTKERATAYGGHFGFWILTLYRQVEVARLIEANSIAYGVILCTTFRIFRWCITAIFFGNSLSPNSSQFLTPPLLQISSDFTSHRRDRLLFTQQLINVATTSFPIQASRFEIHTPTTSFLPLSFPLLTGVDSHVLQRGAGLVGRLVWCCIGARLGLSGLFRPAHHSLYCSQNFRSRGQQTGNWLLVLVLAEADDEARDFRDAVYIRTKGETLCIDGANGWPAQGGLDFSEAGEAVVEVVGMAWQRRHTST